LFRQLLSEGPPPYKDNDPDHWVVKQSRELEKLRQEYTVITYCSRLD
jgi:hypothetical protein